MVFCATSLKEEMVGTFKGKGCSSMIFSLLIHPLLYISLNGKGNGKDKAKGNGKKVVKKAILCNNFKWSW